MRRKCCRTNKNDYQLNFQFSPRDTVRRTTFGKHVLENKRLLKSVKNMLGVTNTQTGLFKTQRLNSKATTVYRQLHWRIKNFFRQYMNTVQQPFVETHCSIPDILVAKAEFWLVNSTRTAKILVQAATKFCFLDVRCPAACFKLVEKTNSIVSTHFEN